VLRGHPSTVAAAAGLLWGAIAWGVAYAALAPAVDFVEVPRFLWGGMLAAPVIGLMIGRASRDFEKLSILYQAWLSLASVGVSAILFVLCNDLWHALVRGAWPSLEDIGLAPFLVFLAVFRTGIVLVLWPLAFLTHRLVALCHETPGPASIDGRRVQ
jgi:hypothetical protein